MPASLMITSFIGAKEGKVLKAYRDPVHIITIGYGATWASASFRRWYAANRGPGKLKMGDTISEAEAITILKLMLDEEYCPPVDAKFAAIKQQNVKDAGYSMTLNAGIGSLAWKWAQHIAVGDIKGGAALWRTTATTAKGKRLPGLIIRRREEADIAEFNRWPAWLKVAVGAAPETRTESVDVRQAQVWLGELGYSPGTADGVPGARTKAAAARFQADHGQLTVDGVIGPATLSALQRAIDLRKKAAGATVGGTAVASAGVAENTTGVADQVTVPEVGHLGWIGDVLLWGGVAVLAAVFAYLAWRYRDELVAVLRRL